jgi:hypothetical protein
MLHITNGDHAADALRHALGDAHLLPWRDVLNEGPVQQFDSLERLSEVRAAFVAEQGWGEAEAVRASFAERDHQFRRAAAGDGEIVLWFEHDLFDQLQLIQVLHQFAERPRPAPVTLINPAEYLGLQEAERLHQLFHARRAVTPEQIALGDEAWLAFTATTPRPLDRLLADDTAPLPHLRAALHRLLEEYPGAHDGLSRTERHLMETVLDHDLPLGEVYLAAHHRREPAIFLGDTAFAAYVERLAGGAHPLLRPHHGGELRAPRGTSDPQAFWASRLRLTQHGEAVLRGEADQVRLNGVDHWIGGVHLRGGGGVEVWRWNAERRQVVEPNHA